jgi:hypothetical protein
MPGSARDIFERAIQRVIEQAANSNATVDEAMAAGLDGNDAVTIHVKRLRAEILPVKASLERELERVVLDCAVWGKRVHRVGGLGVKRGHRALAEPASHPTPKLA